MLPEHGQFRTTEPALKTDLEREHRAVRAELTATREACEPRGRTPVVVTSSPWAARSDDCLTMDASRTVLVPALDADSAGAKITVLRKTGTLTLASDTRAQINGAATATFTVSHRVVAQFDGIDWWAA